MNSSTGDAGEAQNSGDHSDDKERYGPGNHDELLLKVLEKVRKISARYVLAPDGTTMTSLPASFCQLVTQNSVGAFLRLMGGTLEDVKFDSDHRNINQYKYLNKLRTFAPLDRLTRLP